MKVILTDFVPSLGAPGDEVDVAPGYARNYLIPRKLGFEATAPNRKTYENNLKQRARKIARMFKDAEAQKTRIERMDPLVFIRKAGEEGKLFGSVTGADIEEALKERGFDIAKKKIDLAQPIKSLGEADVKIRIHSRISATVKVVVTAEAKEEPKPEEQEQQQAPAPAGEETAQADEQARETAGGEEATA